MKPCVFLVIALLLFAPHFVYAGDNTPFDRLVGHAWALVLTGSEDDPMFIEQFGLLQGVAETLKQREVVTIHFHGRTVKDYPELSVAEYPLPSMKGSKLGLSSHKKIDILESQLQTDDDVFSVVLVDKNGATRYVWSGVVKPDEIWRMMDNPNALPYQNPVSAPAAATEESSKTKLKSFEKAKEVLQK